MAIGCLIKKVRNKKMVFWPEFIKAVFGNDPPPNGSSATQGRRVTPRPPQESVMFPRRASSSADEGFLRGAGSYTVSLRGRGTIWGGVIAKHGQQKP